MSSETPFVTRLRAAVVIVGSLAALYGIVTVLQTSHDETNAKGLRRRNAIRRANRETPTLAISLTGWAASDTQLLSRIIIRTESGTSIKLDLEGNALPAAPRLAKIFSITDNASQMLYKFLVNDAIYLVLKSCVGWEGRNESPLAQFRSAVAWDLRRATAIQIADALCDTISRMLVIQGDRALVHGAILDAARDMSAAVRRPARRTILSDSTGDHPTRATADELKELLYYIGEDQAKRASYHHRGIHCEECGETPIFHIRWHCLNCPDFDLCSACKNTTRHPRNHIFAEIRIPIPVLAQPEGVLPLWYAQDALRPDAVLSPHHRRRLAQLYAWDEPHIEALFEQFICTADEQAHVDSSELFVGISRGTFVRAIGSNRWKTRSPPPVIFDRMFAFYDMQGTGKIVFEDFVAGITYLRHKEHQHFPIRRALIGFNLRENGIIGRDDILQLMRAKFELHRCIVNDVMDHEARYAEKDARHALRTSQPISSIFRGDIPRSAERSIVSKSVNSVGDLVPDDGDGVIATGGRPMADEWAMSGEQIHGDMTSIEQQILGLTDNARTMQNDRRIDEHMLWLILEETIKETTEWLFKDVDEQDELWNQRQHEKAEWDRARRLSAAVRIDLLAMQTRDASSDSRLPVLERHVRDVEQVALMLLEARRIPTPGRNTPVEGVPEHVSEQTQTIAGKFDGSAEDADAARNDSMNTDPTMPQNRPNSIVESNIQVAREELRNKLIARLDEATSKLTEPEDCDRPLMRDGLACLSIDELARMCERPEMSQLRAFARSWLEWASF